jgi:hypothetical protein
VALIDHGSEINLMSKELYEKGNWPINSEHGWLIWAANNSRGDLYGTCLSVKVIIGDFSDVQNFFVQDMSTRDVSKVLFSIFFGSINLVFMKFCFKSR